MIPVFALYKLKKRLAAFINRRKMSFYINAYRLSVYASSFFRTKLADAGVLRGIMYQYGIQNDDRMLDGIYMRDRYERYTKDRY